VLKKFRVKKSKNFVLKKFPGKKIKKKKFRVKKSKNFVLKKFPGKKIKKKNVLKIIHQ